MKRKEIIWSLKENQTNSPYTPKQYRTSDIILTITRKGIEVSGYYDTYVGLGDTVLITWDKIDKMREDVAK